MDKITEMKYQNDYWKTVLEEQLAEKDKEIEKLYKIIDSQKRHIDIIEQPFRGRGIKRTGNVILDFELLIRKQICDEIKEYIAKEYGTSVEDISKLYHCLAWSVKEIYELLDQIVEGDI